MSYWAWAGWKFHWSIYFCPPPALSQRAILFQQSVMAGVYNSEILIMCLLLGWTLQSEWQHVSTHLLSSAWARLWNYSLLGSKWSRGTGGTLYFPYNSSRWTYNSSWIQISLKACGNLIASDCLQSYLWNSKNIFY